MEENKIKNFIEFFNNFKHLQQQQKIRGLNDFNVFTTLLKQHDEVRLHSRFLSFLLNPKSNHNQNDLFLSLFLQECGIANDYFNDLTRCQTLCEYENIDIYITDGNKHIIIENKVWAGDQKAQIKRYIETINYENKPLSNDNLIVIYLSLDRFSPSKFSLCANENGCPNGFYIKNKTIIGKGENSDKKYQFINLNYDKHIAPWLEKSRKQIANITNLSVGITQYQEVIQKLYGTYQEKIMNLKEYLQQNKENKPELVKTMQEISNQYAIYKKQIISDFFEKSQEAIKNKLDNNWKITKVGNNLEMGKRHNFPLRIKQNKESKVLFGFEFGENDYRNPTFGIVRADDKVDFNQLKQQEDIKNLLNKADLMKKSNVWWLKYGLYCDGDLFDKITKDGDDGINKFVDAFINVFDRYKDVVVKCNEILDKS